MQMANTGVGPTSQPDSQSPEEQPYRLRQLLTRSSAPAGSQAAVAAARAAMLPDSFQQKLRVHPGQLIDVPDCAQVRVVLHGISFRDSLNLCSTLLITCLGSV